MQFLLLLPQMTASRKMSSGLNASFVLNPKIILKTSTFQYISIYFTFHPHILSVILSSIQQNHILST